MRSLVRVAVLGVAIVVAGCSTAATPTPSATPTSAPSAAAPSEAASASPAASASASASPAASQALACNRPDLKTMTQAKLTIGTDNPAYGPWFAGPAPAAGSKWENADPEQRPRPRGGDRLPHRLAARLPQGRRRVGPGAVQQRHPARPEDLRHRPQPGLLQRRPGPGGRPLRWLLRQQPGRGRVQGDGDRQGHDRRRTEELPSRDAGRHDEPRLHPEQHPADRAAPRLQHARRGDRGPQGPTDRRRRRRPRDRRTSSATSRSTTA